MNDKEITRLVREIACWGLVGAVVGAIVGIQFAGWLLPVNPGLNFLQIMPLAFALSLIHTLFLTIGAIAAVILKYQYELWRG